jgi:hypothetical protein
MKTKTIFYIVLMFLYLQGCAIFSKKHVSLTDTSISNFKVIYEDSSYSISFDKNLLIQEAFKENKIRPENKKMLEILLNLDKDIYLPTDIGELYHSEDTIKKEAYQVFDKAHIRLLKKGHTNIFDKKANKKEKKIYYQVRKNSLNNTSLQFFLKNGKMFYSYLIAFGE